MQAAIGIKEIGVFTLTCFDATGDISWQEEAYNALADEGEQNILDVYLRAATAPTAFYIGLCGGTPGETTTLAQLTGEPSGNGYSRQQITRDGTSNGWPTLALDTGDYMATSKQVTFTANGGDWSAVTYAFLATTTDNTGKHIAFAALSQSRTIKNGETLQVIYKIKLQ